MEVNNKTAPVTGQQDQNTISLDLMNRMKLHGMAEAFRESLAGTTPQSMTADTFLSMLLAREWDYVHRLPLREWDYRSQAAIARLTKNAAFRYKAYIEQIDYATNRGLERNQMERLATLILCIRHRTFSLLVLPEREKAIWPVPLDTKHAKGDSGPSCQCPETARCAESRQSQRYT